MNEAPEVTTDTPVVARQRPGSYYDPDRVYRSWWAFAAEIVLLVLCIIGDTIAIKGALNAIDWEGDQDLLLLAFVFGLAATAVMMRAGSVWRNYVAGEAPRAKLQCGLLIASWLLMAAALFVMRLLAKPAGKKDLNAQDAVAGAWVAQLPNGLLFLALFLVTGALAWFTGYVWTNPRAGAFRAAHKARAKQHAAAQISYSELIEANELAEHHRKQLDELANSRDRALEDREALRAELKAYARVLMAVHRGDPADTAALTERPPKA